MIRLAASLLAVIVALAAPAKAYKFSGQRWDDTAFPLQWKLDKNGADNVTDGTDNSEVVRAAQAWTDLPCSKVAFAAPDQTAHFTAIEGSDNTNRIGWVEDRSWQYGSMTLGVTTPKYYPPPGGHNEIFDADIVFNGFNYQWTASTPARGPCRNCTDVFSIALHELGHFFGLDHTSIESAVMYASYPGSAKQALAQDDIDAACNLYRQAQPGTGPQGSSCSAQVDCVSGLTCTKSGTMVSNICTKTCTTANPTCPAGLTCQDGATGGKGCFPPPESTGDLCLPCNSGADCDTGICQILETTGICTRACGSDADCPKVSGQSLRCFSVGGQPRCLPVDSATSQSPTLCWNNCGTGCPSGQECVTTNGRGSCQFAAPGANEPCPDGFCADGFACTYLLPDPPSAARCRQDCNPQVPTSCPTGFMCLGDSAGATTGSCLPDDTPPANGKQGDTCSSQAGCAAGFWCKGFGSGVSICVRDCNPAANTCASNLKCNAWSSGAPSGSAGGYCYGEDVQPPVTANECEACGGGVGCKANKDLFCLSSTGGAACRKGCRTDDDCAGGSCETRSGATGFPGVCRCGPPPKGDGEECLSDSQCDTNLLCIIDPTADGARCRKGCSQVTPDCAEGQTCQKLGAASFCLPAQDKADAGTTGGGETGLPCGQCASQNPVGLALLALGLIAGRRRRSE